MIAIDIRESEIKPVMERVPPAILGKIDELKEKRFYKSRQEIFLEVIRDFKGELEAKA
jgi:metal-responsive CopG/Arc/MetJ family transcriptional regulator